MLFSTVNLDIGPKKRWISSSVGFWYPTFYHRVGIGFGARFPEATTYNRAPFAVPAVCRLLHDDEHRWHTQNHIGIHVFRYVVVGRAAVWAGALFAPHLSGTKFVIFCFLSTGLISFDSWHHL